MAAPLRPLYIDIPNAGTARVYFDITGDQFDMISRVWPQVDFKPLGSSEWGTMDETGAIVSSGGFVDVPTFIDRALKYSNAPGYVPIANQFEMSEYRRVVEWFLSKPKAEVDAMISRWVKESMLPWLSTIVTKMLASVIPAGASTPTGVYQNVYDALNAQIGSGVSVSIVNGNINLTKAA